MCQSLNLFYVLNATSIPRVINSDQLNNYFIQFYFIHITLQIYNHPPPPHPKKNTKKQQKNLKTTCEKEIFFHI